MWRYDYLGRPGASGEEALLTHLGGTVKPVGLPSLPLVLRAIETGAIDGGVFPVENASTGPIHNVVHLLETTDLEGEQFWFSVQHCLLGLPGQASHDLRQVLSHPRVLAECAEYVRKLGVEVLSMFDAAACAKYIWDQQLSQGAAVANSRAGHLAQLEVLAQNIQRDLRNLTRYVVLRSGPVLRPSVGIGRPRMTGVPALAEQDLVRAVAPAVLPHLETLDQPGTLTAPAGNGWHTPQANLAVVAPPAEVFSGHTGSTTTNEHVVLPHAFAAPAQVLSRNLSTYQANIIDTEHSPSAPAVPALVLRDVCKTYGRGKKQQLALDHLSLQVEQGSIFGLLGPNGSGKTTTINLISGLLRPSAGSIHILGLDVGRPQALRQIRQRLGAVPQETALYEDLTAQENLAFHAGLYGVLHRQRPGRIREMLELAGLFERRNERVKTFSGGMKRRLAIARALLHDPELLYLDEPTLGVDVQSRRAIWDYILALRERGKTVLITTNYLEEAQLLCSLLAIIDHGKLIALDTPARLKERYGACVIEMDLPSPLASLEPLQRLEGVMRVALNRQRTHLTITTQRMNEVLPRLLAQFPEPPTSIAVHEPNLDDVFLHLTGAALRD